MGRRAISDSVRSYVDHLLGRPPVPEENEDPWRRTIPTKEELREQRLYVRECIAQGARMKEVNK